MALFKLIKESLIKIVAITEKNLKLNLRFKYTLVVSFISPIFGIIMSFFILGKFFEFSEEFGPWTTKNFLVFVFLAYNIILFQRINGIFASQFRQEKFWRTLPAIIIAPTNRYNIIIGITLSHLIFISIPCAFIFIICYIYYPISLMTFLFVMFLFLLLTLFFCGIGIVLGIFAISNEDIWQILHFGFNIIFMFSCLTFPFDIFPRAVQNIISLNPFYYIFAIIRLAWIEDDFILTLTSYPVHMSIIFIFSISFPIIGMIIFNKVYKKLGITGY